MNRLPKLLIALTLILACGTATAFAAKLSGPSKAKVGDTVTAKASGLKAGRYALTLVADIQPSQGAFCVARIGKRHRTSGGRVEISGKIPKRTTCYQGNGSELGKVKVTPGDYHLVVSVPDGPTGSSGKHSFVRRALKIKR